MKPDLSLIGVGLYTPSEAAALTSIPSAKIRRWLRGHTIGDTEYPALWTSNLVKSLDLNSLYLSFLDLVQLRVADAFIRADLSAAVPSSTVRKSSNRIIRSRTPDSELMARR